MGRTETPEREVITVSERRSAAIPAEVMVVAAGLLVFLVFLWLFSNYYLKFGTDISENSGPSGTSATLSGDGPKELSFDTHETSRVVATLVTFRRDVKIRPVDAPAWTPAQSGSTFRFRDALQTMSRSSARIQLEDAGSLDVGPDSLIVFQRGAANMMLPEQATAMLLIDGQVGGEVAINSMPLRRLEFDIPGGRVRFLDDGDGAEALDFNLSVNPDKSSTLALFSGRAEVSAGGQSAVIGANQGITIGNDGVIQAARALPSPPGVVRPRNRHEIRFRNIPDPVQFAWERSALASEYRFQLARDRGFTDIVMDSRSDETTLAHSNLSAGRYFWRVTGMDGWHAGRPSAIRTLSVVRDLEAPGLTLDPPEVIAGAQEALISGRSDSDSRIFVQNEPVRESAEGRFRHRIPLDPGVNLVTVEAVDGVGNVTYSTQFVHADPSPGGGE